MIEAYIIVYIAFIFSLFNIKKQIKKYRDIKKQYKEFTKNNANQETKKIKFNF